MKLKRTTHFESSEHKELGQITLPGLPPDQQKLTMPNGVNLSVGDIIALAGDYYGIANKPISFGKDENDRKNRFLDAYRTLAYSKRRKIRNILEIIQGQLKSIDEAMAQGNPEYVGVQRYKWKEVLKALYYTKLNVVRLSEMSFDHMEENTLIAHQAGHILAMEAAARAHYLQDPKQKYAQLAYAYSLELFACHFLTDHFASGHIRTPSVALHYEFGTEIGGLLASIMHNEENAVGLNVTNARGDSWKSYGDARLFESYNKKTREITIEALKIVINEVYSAFTTGQVPTNKYSAAYQLIPQALQENPSPMFINDRNNIQILYRSDLDDINCKDYKRLTRAKIPYVLLSHYMAQTTKDSLKKHKLAENSQSVGEKALSRLMNFSLFKATKKQDGAPDIGSPPLDSSRNFNV